MKEFLKKRFVGRGIGFYIGFAAAIAMIVFDIAYIIADRGDRTCSMLSFALVLAGSVLYIAYAVLGLDVLDFVPVATCALYGVAFGHHLMLGLETLSDVWNDVNFVGGNATMAVAFIVMFAVGTVAAVTASFFKENK